MLKLWVISVALFFANAATAQSLNTQLSPREVQSLIQSKRELESILGRLHSDANKTLGLQSRDFVNAMSKTIEVLDAKIKGIYGVDDRRNYDATDIANFQKVASEATLALVRSDRFKKSATGNYDLPDGTANLCTPAEIRDYRLLVEKEPFSEEPAPAFCSGFKIADDVVVTAGHCIKDEADCATTKFVQGFRITSANKNPHKNITSDRIFSCKQVLATVLKRDGADFAIVKTDRPMPNVRTAMLRLNGAPQKNDKLTVIGHPMGLPVKIAGGASVREIRKEYFIANLDTYGGNSGSAVFSTKALSNGVLQVEGILVRGEEDFAQTSPCRISKRCGDRACRGEDVTLASEVRKALR